MKPFTDLTRLGRIRRMRQLAQTALGAYGLPDARLIFLRQAGNTLFRVKQANPIATSRPGLYIPGEYMLRIYQPSYQSPESIALELAWMASMCREADLPVQEPVTTLDGRLLTQVHLPGVPGTRTCSLLRWMQGRELKRSQIRSYHFRALGELTARMHQHAARWQPPAGLSKRTYDWEGMYQDDTGEGILARDAWSMLPQGYVPAFEQVALEVKQAMQAWGKHPEIYGLIHADLGLMANVLFWGGQARVIDFEASGFGYYIYDLSVVLEDCLEEAALPQYRDALLEGYTRVRPLSEEQIGSMDHCLAAFHVFWSLWGAAAMKVYPGHDQEILERMERYHQRVVRYLAHG